MGGGGIGKKGVRRGWGDIEREGFTQEVVTKGNPALLRCFQICKSVLERIFEGYAKPLVSEIPNSICFEDFA
jgi:hypothetical protein